MPYMTFNWICIVCVCVFSFFLQIKLTVSLYWNQIFSVFWYFPQMFLCLISSVLICLQLLYVSDFFFVIEIVDLKCVLDRSKRITHNNRTYLYEVPTLVWLQSECKLQTLIHVNWWMTLLTIEMLPTFYSSIAIKYSFFLFSSS